MDFHVYVKGWLLAKVYIIVHNAMLSHNIKGKIIFPFMRSGILLFVHSFVLATALIMNTVYTTLCFFLKKPTNQIRKEMNRKVGAAR